MTNTPLIPPGWTRARLTDVATEYSVRVNNPSESGYDRFVGSEHIGRFETQLSRWGSTADVTSAMKTFQPGDYLLVRRSLYASDFRERAARASFAGVCSGDILTIREREGTIASGFLSCVLNSPPLWRYIVAHATGTITRRIKWRQLSEFEFALPPMKEQRRIVEVLSTCNRTVECTYGALAALRELRRSAIRQRFGLPGAGRDKAELVPLSSVCEVVRGASPRPAGDPKYFNGAFMPWITVGEVTKDDDVYLTSTTTHLTRAGSELSRILTRGTVVLTNSGFSLGVPKILAIDGCANDGIAAFQHLDESIEPLFLYYALLGMTTHLRTTVAAGGDQPNLNTTRIGALRVPLLSAPEQRAIVAELQSISNGVEALIVRRRVASDLFRRLMQECMMRGSA